MITFVGIIGKQDRPLYLKSHGTSNFPEIRLVEWAYSACDIFQERLNTGVNANDFYFGMLTAFDGVVYYGSMSKTGIKFILALQEQTMLISDAMVRSTLQKIHAEYTKAVMNPFHLSRVDDYEPISSPKLDREISRIVSLWRKG